MEMNIEDFREYCLGLEGATEKTPFGKFARRYDSILVFYICGHMFCMTDMDDFTSVTVKLLPEEIEEKRQRYRSAIKPTHMHEKHWVELHLNGDIPPLEIQALVKRSYDIVKAKYTGKKPKPKTARKPTP